MTPKEKLGQMLRDQQKDLDKQLNVPGKHLSNENFVQIIRQNLSTESLDKNFPPGFTPNIEKLREHLSACTLCLDNFSDFYAFYAPADELEEIISGEGMGDAWREFSKSISMPDPPKQVVQANKEDRKANFFAYLGWAFASLLLLFSIVAALLVRQAENEKTQLAAQLESQKHILEKQLHNDEQKMNLSATDEQEKARLAIEKDELQKRITELESEVAIAKKTNQNLKNNASPVQNQKSLAIDKADSSLVAVNTPIYDVFPADVAVRGEGGVNQASNKLVVPVAAKNVVLILNTAGLAEFSVNQILLVNNAGKTVWRGSGLRKDATGNFTLTISRAALKTGNYRLKIISSSKTVAEYPISVQIGK